MSKAALAFAPERLRHALRAALNFRRSRVARRSRHMTKNNKPTNAVRSTATAAIAAPAANGDGSAVVGCARAADSGDSSQTGPEAITSNSISAIRRDAGRRSDSPGEM